MEVNNNLSIDPTSTKGILLGEKFMLWVNGVYGKKYAHLRTKKFEQGFGEGKGLDEVGLTTESVAWIEKAMDAYWRHRIIGILAKVGEITSAEVLILWNAMLDDMYGDDSSRKNAIADIALQDETISNDAKKWLRNLSTS